MDLSERSKTMDDACQDSSSENEEESPTCFCKSYLPYQSRVIDERNALREKIDKLNAYLENDGEENDLLCIQLAAMETYLSILNVRIQRFW